MKTPENGKKDVIAIMGDATWEVVRQWGWLLILVAGGSLLLGGQFWAGGIAVFIGLLLHLVQWLAWRN